jgi:oligopeptide/dipeptide ABC transporter ATP-binding protein
MTGPLLKASDVSVLFPGRSEPAVDDVSVTIEAGAALGIVGETGSGKTTLARVLVGALRPTGGTMLVAGTPWQKIRRTDELRRRIQMVFQDPYGSLNPWRTALETVSDVIRHWDGLNRGRAEAAATDLLAEVGLSRDAMHRRPGRLSGGQCQRVGIARALASRPDVLVADEPTSSLDVSVQAQILNLLLSLRESRSLALVLISHDLMVVDYVTTEAIIMYKGCVVEDGPTRALLAAPKHPYTRILVDSIPGREGGTGYASNDIAAAACVFAPRCPQVQTRCVEEKPTIEIHHGAQSVACHFPLGGAS